MTDTIFIHGLTTRTIIGCLPTEKLAPQLLIIDLDLVKDLQQAAHTDDITFTIDYAHVAKTVQEFVQQTRYELIETLAEHLARMLLASYPITSVKVKITKPEAIPDLPAVGVVITRSV